METKVYGSITITDVSDGTSFQCFTTEYSDVQKTIESWAQVGNERQWTVNESTAVLKIDDTVLLGCYNTTKNGYSYIIATVTSVDADKVFTAISVGLLDKGDTGADGDSLYTWIKYADDASGTNMSDDSNGKKYIGIAYNKTTATESATASDYMWSLIKGADGVGISSTTVTYGISSSSSTQPTVWYPNPPDVAKGEYLWTCTVIDYTDSSKEDTVTYTYARQGDDGKTPVKGVDYVDGTSVTVSSIQYQAGTSATTAPTGTWSDTVVPVDEGQYLWTKTTFSDGKFVYGVAKQGVSGKSAYEIWLEQGNTGTEEDYLESLKGETGRGEASRTKLYYISTSDKDAPATPDDAPTLSQYWSSAFPTSWDSTTHIWTTTEIEWNDGTFTYSPKPPILISQIEAATLSAQLSGKSLGEWCTEQNITIIDGSTIMTGSIDAEKLNVTELSAITGNMGLLEAGVIQSKGYKGMMVWGDDENASVGLDYQLSDDGQSYSVIGIGECTDTYLVIPSVYQGLPVTFIGAGAFSGCSRLIRVKICNGINTIGQSAFWGCSNLISVVIPNSVTSIYDDAFYGCRSLTNITIPDSVASISEAMFSGCSGLTAIVIPNSVTMIHMDAFDDCDSLTSVYYKGTAEEFDAIYDNSNVSSMENVTIYYYSETKPTASGNYWHYNDDGFRISCDDMMIDSKHFKVTQDGKVSANEGDIGGWIIEDDRLVSEAKNVSLYSSQDMHNGFAITAGGYFTIGSTDDVRVIYKVVTDADVDRNYDADTDIDDFGIDSNGAYLSNTFEDNIDIYYYQGTASIDGDDYDLWTKKEYNGPSYSLYTNRIFSYPFILKNNGDLVARNASIQGSIQSRDYETGNGIVAWHDSSIYINLSKDQSYELKYSREYQDDTVIVTGIETNVNVDLIIPKYINGRSVALIAEGAFKDNKYITSLSVLSPTCTIGANAFNGCTNMRYVHLPHTTTVATGAFSGCDNLIGVFSTLSELDDGKKSEYINGGLADSIKEVKLDASQIGIVCTGNISDGNGSYRSNYKGETKWMSVIFPNLTIITHKVNGVELNYDSSKIVYNQDGIKLYAYFDGNIIYYKYSVNKSYNTQSDVGHIRNFSLGPYIQTATLNHIPILFYSESNTYDESHWHYGDFVTGWKISSDTQDKLVDSEYFKVTHDGMISATSGKIGNCTISKDGSIQSENCSFMIDPEGNVVAAGTITANNGQIGGLKIEDDGSLTSLDTDMAVQVNGMLKCQDITLVNNTISVNGRSIDFAAADNIIRYTLTIDYHNDGTNAQTISIFIDPKPVVHITGTFNYRTNYGNKLKTGTFSFSPNSKYQYYYSHYDYWWGLDKPRITSVNGVDCGECTEYSFEVSVGNNINVTGNLLPSGDNEYSLGLTTNRWSKVHAATAYIDTTTSTTAYTESGDIGSSDRNVKYDIDAMDERYSQLFDQLHPSTFKFTNGTSGRVHMGLIAQDVKDSLDACNISTDEFAAYCRWTKDDGTETCGIRYGEFVALNIYEIQKLKKLVKELEAEVKMLKAQQNDSD